MLAYFRTRPATLANLRRHLLKGTTRVLVLLSADLGAFLLARWGLRVVGYGASQLRTSALAQSAFAEGVVPGHRLAVTLLAVMLILGVYGAGDAWRKPARVIGAVAVAVSLVLYLDMWGASPLLMAERGLVVWTTVCVALVCERWILKKAVAHLPRSALRHRVLQVSGERSNGRVDLGEGYEYLTARRAEDLPSDLEDMSDWLAGGVDTVVISGEIDARRFGMLTDFALANGCRLLGSPRSIELAPADSRRVWMMGKEYSELTAPALQACQLIMKRVFDIVIGAVFLVLVLPVMAAIALLIRLESPGPVLFRHRRAGRGGQFFDLLKFRSMCSNAEEILHRDPELYLRYVENNFKLPEDEDPRLTRLGRFLRCSSLDELPQLFNVLKGAMSLVGPRPVTEPELGRCVGRLPTFLSVKPGVTGLWQVNGRSKVSYPERLEIDLTYVRTWSLVGDLWILVMTIPAVLLRRGAH